MQTAHLSEQEVIRREKLAQLKALGIEGRQCQKETLPREWFDGPVQVETLEAIRGW